MRGPILIVGASGRMSQELQKSCKAQELAFDLWPSRQSMAPSNQQWAGIIDFTTPESSLRILDFACGHRLPLVCGTTGWTDLEATDQKFRAAAQSIPIVRDSNFSQGIEIFCQLAEIMAQRSLHPLALIDLHHEKKKDAPSGTALKIKKRMERVASNPVTMDSIRLGDIPGEHRLLLSFQDQTLEIVHRAHSRKPFSEGALTALGWAQQQKPGLYSMEDILT